MAATLIQLEDMSIVSESHPDHQALYDWLTRHEVVIELATIPNEIKVTKEGITLRQYLRDPDTGTIRRTPDGTGAQIAPTLYQCNAYPVPKFKRLKVTNG